MTDVFIDNQKHITNIDPKYKKRVLLKEFLRADASSYFSHNE